MAVNTMNSMTNLSSTLNLLSFNCSGLNHSNQYIIELVSETEYDIMCLQETWLLNENMHRLGDINNDYPFTGISGVDSGADVLRGRPHGGVGILWKKTMDGSISVLKTEHKRLSAIKLVISDFIVLILTVYMPCDNQSQTSGNEAFVDTLNYTEQLICGKNITL